jgi:hypothetical protein
MRHLIVSIMETPILVSLLAGMLIIPPICGIMIIHREK